MTGVGRVCCLVGTGYERLSRLMTAFRSLATRDKVSEHANRGRLGYTHECGGCKHAVLHGIER
jgi:hypothetical protein